MKRFLKCRALSILMAVALLVGMLPVDLLGGVATVLAATDANGVSKEVVGDTTTWDFSAVTASAQISVDSDVQGIVAKSGLIYLKEKCLDLYGEQSGKTNGLGSVAIPLDSATTSVDVTIVLSGTGSADGTYGGRRIRVGNDANNVVVFQKSAEVTDGAESFDGSKTWTKTLDSTYFTDNTLLISGAVGENKISSISITETKSAEVELVGFSRTYDFRDGSVVPTSTTNGNTEMTSGDGLLTVAPGAQSGYKYNGVQHGVQFGNGCSIAIKVKQGSGTVTLGTCNYSTDNAATVTMNGTSLGTLATKAAKCYDTDKSNVVSFDYTCEEAEAEILITFNATVYVPVLMISGMEPKPAVEEVEATVNIASGTELLGDGEVTLTNAADETDAHSVSAGDAKTFILKSNSTYNLTTDNEDLAAQVNGKTSFATKTEALDVAIDVVSLVVNPTVKLAEGSALAEGKTLTITKAGDANGTALTVDSSVKLVIGETYSISTDDETVEARVNGKTSFEATADMTELTVELVSKANQVTMTVQGDGVSLGSDKVVMTNIADANDVVEFGNGDTVELQLNATYELTCTNKSIFAKIDGKQIYTVENAIAALTVDLTAAEWHTYDVWDFAGEALENTEYITYNNLLTPAIINSWYPEETEDGTSVTVGTSLYLNLKAEDYVVGDMTVAAGGIQKAWRLRINAECKDVIAESYTDGPFVDAETEKIVTNKGIIYSNKTASEAVGIDMTVAKGDIVKVLVSSNGGNSDVTWQAPSGEKTVQTYTGGSRKKMQEKTFYASEDGTYHMYSANEKLVVGRVYRETPNTATVSGSITVPEGADLTGANLVFTQIAADGTEVQEIKVPVSGNSYETTLQEYYTYKVSLEGANGYIIDTTKTGTNGEFYIVSKAGSLNVDTTIISVELVDVTGSLAELTAEDAAKLELIFTSDEVYVPEFSVKAGTNEFTAVLEKDVTYTLTAKGVDDYTLDTATIVATADGTQNIMFTKKPVYAVNLTLEGPSVAEAANAVVVFSRLDENTLDGTLDGYTYTFTGIDNIALRDGQYVVEVALDGYTQQITSDVKVAGAAVNKTVVMKSDSAASETVEYKEVITVGETGDYQTINAALDAVRNMTREEGQRVTISIEPGDYEEMLIVDVDNVTLQNAAGENASIELTNKGVGIAENAVRITGYYGHGYNYYSMDENYQWNADVLAANKENGYHSVDNIGSGSKTMWNATVQIYANGFEADGIIFENSFNQYVSKKAAEDTIVKWDTGAKEGTTPRAGMAYGDTTVQQYEYKERAAALAIGNSYSDIVFDNCKFIGRQDTLYGGTNTYAEFNECSIYGSTDYIFGGMIAIFNKCDLVFNTSDNSNDYGYITAAQQKSGRGYLMYECHVTSTVPGVDTASTMTSKPGYFGRPWEANTSETVFYNTTIDAADAYWETAGAKTSGKSLIVAAGWDSTLSSTSEGMYEYGTIEAADVDNSTARAEWTHVLTEPVLNDGTVISLEAFQKAEPIVGLYNIDLSQGLKAGTTYDGGISVMEDMPMKPDGFVQGSTNPGILPIKDDGKYTTPKGEVPVVGAVLVLNAEKDGYLKCDIKEGGKDTYFVDGNTNKYETYKQGSAGSLFKSFKVKAGHTYYLYASGSKICLYSVTVDYREPYNWNTVEVPVLGEPIVSGGDIIVPFEAQVGGLYAESLEVIMMQDGEIVDSISYVTESEEGSVTFTPDASGTYSFFAKLKRSGMLSKESDTTNAVEFILPMHTPVIVNVENKGSGNVKFSWQEVPEADCYEVYLDGELKETVTVPYARFEGLTVGTEYEFGVKALGNDTVSEMATMKQTVTADAQKSWLFSAFGQGVDTKNNKVVDGIDSKDDISLSIWGAGGKGKLVPASTDGLAFYYTTIDPTTENFTLTADVTVDEWTYSNGQEGFGLMAADAVGTHGDSSVFWNNSYMNAVTKVEYFWDSAAGAVTSDNTMSKYSMKLGVGSQEKIGVSKDNLEEIQGGNLTDFKSTMDTLETSAAEANKGAGTYNLAGNYTNDTDLGDLENIQTTFHLTIQRNNTGYILSYTDAKGKTTSNTYYHGDNGDELTQIDPYNIYVGFFASRNAKITVNNVNLTTINPSEDAPAQERPIETVKPSYTVVSAAIANSSDYELVYYGNVDGKLTVELDGEVLVSGGDVTAKTKYRVPATLKLGQNDFKVTVTPNADYKISDYEILSTYEPQTFVHSVNFSEFERDVIYVAPNGTGAGKGTKYSPMDIYTAVKFVQPGDKILLMEGTYSLRGTVTVERGIDGTADNMIYMMADPAAETRPVLDFNKSCAGMVFAGDYWYLKGFDVTNSANGQKGVQISGSNNVVENLRTYKNGNTGIQISRFKSSDLWEDWPANNLILNCTSYLNADAGYEDADGFAAKLTVAEGNVFDGCVAAYNADDGWDLFAKIESGLIGQVTIKNSIAFKNGYVVDENGNEVNAGNGNGFKMGGSSMSGKHLLENSVAFANKAKGIDANSCPDIIVRNSTSFDNESYNVAFYTNDAKNTDFDARGVLSYKVSNTEGENLKPKGLQDESKIYDASNYYFYGDASKNSEGAVVSADWFVNLDTEAAITGITRNADGTINMNGFLELTDAAPAGIGAVLTDVTVSSGDIDVPTVPSTGVTVDQTTVTLEVGDTAELKATLTPDDTTDGYVWSSDNTAVATVSKDGVVTAVAAGKATITVTTESGKTASCVVTVNAPVIEPIPTTTPTPTTTPAPTATPVPTIVPGAPVVPDDPDGVAYKADKNGVTVTSIDKTATKITIPATITVGGKEYPVTGIAKNAFKNNKKITSVTIGNNVTSIGDYAFYGCTKLKTVKIGKNVVTIGKCAFGKNTSLTSITIPDKVKTVGANAFDGCSKLKTVKLGKSLTAISDKMFYKCKALTKVTIPSKVTKIGKSAFAYCSKLSSVTIGKKVSTIGSSAFYKCTSLKKVTIPSGVKTIGGSAFSGCSKLATLTIGSKVTTIDKNAFSKCTALKKVTIPASVKTIGANAFNGCKNLKSITIKTTKLTSKTVGSKAFSGINAKATIKVPSKKLADYKKLLVSKGVKKTATIKK